MNTLANVLQSRVVKQRKPSTPGTRHLQKAPPEPSSGCNATTRTCHWQLPWIQCNKKLPYYGPGLNTGPVCGTAVSCLSFYYYSAFTAYHFCTAFTVSRSYRYQGNTCRYPLSARRRQVHRRRCMRCYACSARRSSTSG